METYRQQLKENCIYAIKNFKVEQSIKYRPVSNDLKIVFTYNTNVSEVKEDSHDIPNYYFDFATKDILMEREAIDIQCSGT